MKFVFKLKTYMPLIIIFSIIILFTAIKALYTQELTAASLMIDFMAGFFIIFGGFKASRLKAFAEAYALYDIIAKRSKIYAHTYPFIEIGLGLAFLLGYELIIVSWITLVLMSINSIGAYMGIRNKKVLMCVCLGTVFKLPMSYVSLAEGVLMVVMAGLIIIGI